MRAWEHDAQAGRCVRGDGVDGFQHNRAWPSVHGVIPQARYRHKCAWCRFVHVSAGPLAGAGGRAW